MARGLRRFQGVCSAEALNRVVQFFEPVGVWLERLPGRVVRDREVLGLMNAEPLAAELEQPRRDSLVRRRWLCQGRLTGAARENRDAENERGVGRECGQNSFHGDDLTALRSRIGRVTTSARIPLTPYHEEPRR